MKILFIKKSVQVLVKILRFFEIIIEMIFIIVVFRLGYLLWPHSTYTINGYVDSITICKHVIGRIPKPQYIHCLYVNGEEYCLWNRCFEEIGKKKIELKGQYVEILYYVSQNIVVSKIANIQQIKINDEIIWDEKIADKPEIQRNLIIVIFSGILSWISIYFDIKDSKKKKQEFLENIRKQLKEKKEKY
jgi:hypothetical protein